MANPVKISELSTDTPAATGLVPFSPSGGATSKKCTVLALRGNLTPVVLATGFSIAGGTTPKTLTVDADITASTLATQTYADGKIPKTDIDTDGALTANSDTKVPSQQAVKEYAIPLSAIDTDEALTANSDSKVPSQQAVKAAIENAEFAGVPDAAEATKGKAELATQAEVNAGTDDERIVTPLKIATFLRANNTIGYVASANNRNSNTTARTTTSASYTKVKEISIDAIPAGLAQQVIRVYCTVACPSDASYYKVYKNGSPIGAEHFYNSSSPQTHYDDIAVSQGDLIQIYAHNVDGVHTLSAYDMYLSYDEAVISLLGLTLTTPLVSTTMTAMTVTNNS